MRHISRLLVLVTVLVAPASIAIAQSEFIRGDCNADGAIDLGDPIATLSVLFSGAATPTCLDACDSNDDGLSDIGDPIFVLSYLFSEGVDPPMPFPACGSDPTSDPVDCVAFAFCFVPVETCSNGIDDDADGLIDCLDSDCLGDPACFTGSPLVINEIDYDQPGPDTDEFVEIYNPGSSPAPLAGLYLALVNGSNNSEYDLIDLSAAGASLPADGYLVIHSSTVVIDAAALSILFGNATDNIQNGAPDGMAIVHLASNTVVDALSYEGEITAATITGMSGPVNLVEGTATLSSDDNINLTAVLIRCPNGADSDDASNDWGVTIDQTPGSTNGSCKAVKK